MTSGPHGHDAEELHKVQQHLRLLRTEYTKLQSKYDDLHRAHALVTANKGGQEDSFAANILRHVEKLYRQQKHSDVQVKLSSEMVPAHQFVLSARSSVWSHIEDNSQLDWSHLDPSLGHALLCWIYSDRLDIPTSAPESDNFLLSLMRTSNDFQLKDLMHKCEETLLCSVNVSNCIKYYATAEEINAQGLKEHCSQLISTHWDDFTSVDFVDMPAPLLFSMLKSKSNFPLHAAIRLKREDVVFLYLVEFNKTLSTKLNCCDDRGCLPIDLALSSGQESVAKTLLDHKADVDQKDDKERPLIHIAIQRGDEFSSIFLLENGADPNPLCGKEQNSPLHEVSKFKELTKVAEVLIKKGARINAQNRDSATPLHLCITHDNESMLDLLLSCEASPDIKTSSGYPALWLALQKSDAHLENSFAQKLIKSKASTAMVCGSEGNTLLHLCALNSLEKSGNFLCHHCTDLDRTNHKGQTALHLAALNGLPAFTKTLLECGAIPNVQTIMTDGDEVFRQTPLHVAIENKQIEVIEMLLEGTKTNLNMKDSSDHTPLSLALSNGLHDVAVQLLNGGASVNVTNSEGFTLLHCAILDGDAEGANFLLNNGADIDLRTEAGETPLELSIRKSLTSVADCLCRKGADLSHTSGPDPPLWQALQSDQDLASVLVRHGVDTDGWGEGPDGCHQTLLHRAIDENNEDAACFLIRSGCDLNSPRRVGPDGRGGDEAHDLATPLHLCCQWGLESTAQCLIEHGAGMNVKDVEGKTPLHIAIENGHHPIINLLLSVPSTQIDLSLRDKTGLSPFATAMTFKNNKAAKLILQMEPQAAEQYDNRGRNFLHTAIMKNDLESVLFLLSINVNVNSRTQDANLLTPLLLAVQVGNEMVVRNLILAGASVNVRNTTEQTCLHVASENNLSSICSILLSNDIDFSAVDNRLNNALHVAVKEGHLSCVRTLLTESQIDAEAFNAKGRNPLHVLAVFGKENSASIFELFVECMPQYPINKTDGEGNSPLLLAYGKGNSSLCKSLVRSGAVLGTRNHEGVSIFNFQVATKKLLYGILDFLSEEPKWGEGDVCEECGTKFGITTRKHHCRHCGRLLCSKCSDKDMPIMKYNLTKPVRVCDICSDLLTLGPGVAS